MLDVMKILTVFIIIIVVLLILKNLSISILVGTVSAAFLFRLGFIQTLSLVAKSLISELTIITILAFYTITFLQRMMEKRGKLDLAQKALNGVFNNSRVNSSLAPAFIGMLPSAAAVTICGAIVDRTAGNRLTTEEKAFVASYFRHIPEAFLPTYSSIIIGVQLTGQSMSSFVILTLPLIFILAALGYLFYLRKVPKETGQPSSTNKKRDIVDVFQSFWTILLTIAIIMIFDLRVYIAVGIAIVTNILIEKFKWEELKPMIFSAFESQLILTTICVMIFKDIVLETGVINSLPTTLAALPIPSFLTFFIIFFCGTIISGQQSINVVGLPLAFATIPNAGTPLLVFLMSTGYAAMQMSPTHICLTVITNYFGIDMTALIKKTIPVITTFCVILIVYYLILTEIFIY